jgi:hypothetical protein
MRERKELHTQVRSAIEDYKRSYGEIPLYGGNGVTLESLTKDDRYKWMLDVDMNMYHELIKNSSPEEVANTFYTSAFNDGLNCIDLYPEIKDLPMTRKPLIALDFEATGLDLSAYKFGGRTQIANYITGICLGYVGQDMREHSIYIPVLHTETDGVPNLLYSKAVELVQKIFDNFTVIFHNAMYDRETASINGVVINNIGGFFDTMIIAKQTEVMLSEYPKIGLKELSEQLLDRPQITLTDIDAKEKGYHNLSYSEMNVYGHGDASNTLALFRYFITEYSDLFKNMTLMNLDAKALDCTLVFNRRGFPANKDYMYKALTDTMRRVALLQESLIAICEELGFETDDIYISKTQAISRQLINVYASNFKEFVKRRTNVDIDIYDDETSRQKFVNAVQEDLDITIKVEFLKSSGALKMTHSMDVHNLKDLQENAESVRWLNPRTAEKISELCTVLLEASSVLQNANTYYTPFLNGLTFDDTGYYKLPVNLKFASTITTRYANAKGKPSRIFVNAMKTKTTYPLVLDNGLSGVNAQGLPSGQYNIVKAKRILDVKSLGKTVYNELMRREPDIQDDVYFKLMS